MRSIRTRINESGRNIRLEVDGGVKVNNIKEIAEAGADMFVAGSDIFDSEDYQRAIGAMRSELAQLK
ncbi:ribulose phosphate epimerase [Vibrio atlanticus]|nr:ribulose phosphate epimerase [Vibrio atlanticus]